MKNLTASECAAWLKARDGYIILSHIRPDGDTIGSGAALCSALRRAGKTAYCYDNKGIKRMFAPFAAPYLAGEGFCADTVISVDVASERLFPEGFDGKVELAIDHHPTNTLFAENVCIAAEKAACGELVLEIIRELCGDVTAEEAELLYVAVSTDTGCFQYSNTNAPALRAAAELIELGADNSALNIRLFRSISRARMALEGRIMAGMRYFHGGKVSAALVTRALLAECGATEDDCEDLAGLVGKVEGCSVSLLIRELGENDCKISARSKPGVDVSRVCAVYGGGGHAMASGCTLNCPPEEGPGADAEGDRRKNARSCERDTDSRQAHRLDEPRRGRQGAAAWQAPGAWATRGRSTPWPRASWSCCWDAPRARPSSPKRR